MPRLLFLHKAAAKRSNIARRNPKFTDRAAKRCKSFEAHNLILNSALSCGDNRSDYRGVPCAKFRRTERRTSPECAEKFPKKLLDSPDVRMETI